MDTAPGDALVLFLDDDVALFCFDIRTDDPSFVESSPRFDVLRLDLFSSQRDLNDFIRCQQVAATQQQRVDCISGRLGGFPIPGLFLLEQPDFAVLD